MVDTEKQQDDTCEYGEKEGVCDFVPIVRMIGYIAYRIPFDVFYAVGIGMRVTAYIGEIRIFLFYAEIIRKFVFEITVFIRIVVFNSYEGEIGNVNPLQNSKSYFRFGEQIFL